MLSQSSYCSGMDETMTLTLRAAGMTLERKLQLRMWAEATDGLRLEVRANVVRLIATTADGERALKTLGPR